MTVLENLLVPMDYLGKRSADEIERADEVLQSVGLIGRRSDPSETLSQLELRKLELARALVAEPGAAGGGRGDGRSLGERDRRCAGASVAPQ